MDQNLKTLLTILILVLGVILVLQLINYPPQLGGQNVIPNVQKQNASLLAQNTSMANRTPVNRTFNTSMVNRSDSMNPLQQGELEYGYFNQILNKYELEDNQSRDRNNIHFIETINSIKTIVDKIYKDYYSPNKINELYSADQKLTENELNVLNYFTEMLKKVIASFNSGPYPAFVLTDEGRLFKKAIYILENKMNTYKYMTDTERPFDLALSESPNALLQTWPEMFITMSLINGRFGKLNLS